MNEQLASEARLRALVQNSTDVITLFDAGGAVVYQSPSIERLLGYGVDNRILLNFFSDSMVHPDDLEAKKTFFDTIRSRPKSSIRGEFRLQHADGSWRNIEMFGENFLHDPAVAGIVTNCRDITERRHFEEDLRRTKDAADAANRAKVDFLANVSHEMRTPMNAIIGMTELVLDSPLDEGQRQGLKTVRSAAENLLDIINDLLELSKIEAGKLELELAGFSLRSALGDTLRTLGEPAHKKGLELIYSIDPDVPDALIGDICRLRQVILNLVGNAVKFTKEGSVVVRVEINKGYYPEPTPGPREVSIRCTVRDTGIGIPVDQQERIFRAFEQEDTSTTRKFGGSGLGLTIAARLVALMGGSITVDSSPGRGSTFAFTACFGRQQHPTEQVPAQSPVSTHELLVHGSAPPSPLPTTHDQALGGHGPVAAPLNILVGEDNELSAQVLEQSLVRQGHRVRLASNGREVLSVMEQGQFDLLLVDVHMPEIDGFQVVRAIRERESTARGHLPIIALTARSRKEDCERCLAVGMDDFLTKPIRSADLLAAVRRVVKTHLLSRFHSQELLDAPVLLAACGSDPGLLAKMCRTLTERLPEHLATLREALHEQDSSRLCEAAHKSCGMLSEFSSAAGDLAGNLEELAAGAQFDKAAPILEQLEARAQELVNQVNGITVESLRRQAEELDEHHGTDSPLDD